MVEPEVSAALYRDARQRIITLVAELDVARLATPVPGCPRWTVHNLLSHLAGVCTDVVTGNLAGAPGDEWTAAQVSARTGHSVAELVTELEKYGPGWEEIVRRAEHRGFIVRNPYLDTGVHEADLRGALGAGRPPAEVTLAITDAVLPRISGTFDDLGSYTVITPDREYRLGSGDHKATVRVDTYELSRAVFGRRSRAQVEAWDWTGPPGQFPERLAVFTPAAADVVD
ncbi:MAG TPA: maleylpyruvate isomerase family mycothiol-dependent enzyme [Actinophytocola sp.]|uniref:maleylpyruvate isomerase family mycothiol-dependent enzyme n=1 Tax=Actinophytocola sp. TaxID=1872138 RepID=UPI002DB9C1B6|nr:maleylpyruvate isomerase family mycothiol-dependent enzyme [Actinophytocola sp.]HEU5470415.1 maleylpyruvate isomerase family mycothiol-dependent enzyme [Actinophytocola sp.]